MTIIEDVEMTKAFATNSVSTVSPGFFQGKKIIELINYCILENNIKEKKTSSYL